MANKTSQRPLTLEPTYQRSFSGGINTSIPPERLQDTEAVDILNFEFDLDDHLITRSGVSEYYPAKFEKRITSLHYSENDAGDVFILNTSGPRLYAAAIDDANPVDITGALVLPADNYWQWVNYGGIAIGVNKATTGNNPIKVGGAIPTAAPLGGSPPKGKYIAVWNERVWIVDADNPNTVVSSALGDPEDYITVGSAGTVEIDIGKNDGDKITGLFAWRDRLFVFKRTKIYFVAALDGTSAYDSGNLIAQIYASGIGCISAYTIKEILDDVLFLSDRGVCSLVSAPLGELKSVVISRNVKEIQKLRKVNPEFCGYVCEESNQYWLMVSDQASPRNIWEIYVMDYRRIQEGVVRWLRFDGKIAGPMATTIYVNGQRLTIIASSDHGVYSYTPANYIFDGVWDEATWDASFWDTLNDIRFLDVNESYRKMLITKAYDFGLPILRKLFHRFGFNLTLLSNNLKLDVQYFFNKIYSRGGTYQFDYTRQDSGAIWDESNWDDNSSTWDADVKVDFNTIRQFLRNIQGRKGDNVSLIFSNFLNEGFILRDVYLEVAPLNTHQANDIGRIE